MESDCELEIFAFGNQVFTGMKDTGGICHTNSVLLKGVNLGGKFFIVFIMVKMKMCIYEISHLMYRSILGSIRNNSIISFIDDL